MSKDKEYVVGSILKAQDGTYTKIISEKRGVYGISGWSQQRSAKESTVAHKFINKYGLRFANVQVISCPEEIFETTDENDAEDTIDLATANGNMLKAYAKDNGIDIKGAKNVNEIRELVITASQNDAEDTIEEEEEESEDID